MRALLSTHSQTDGGEKLPAGQYKARLQATLMSDAFVKIH